MQLEKNAIGEVRANLNQQNPRKLKLEANIHKPSGHGKIVGITDYGTRSTS